MEELKKFKKEWESYSVREKVCAVSAIILLLSAGILLLKILFEFICFILSFGSIWVALGGIMLLAFAVFSIFVE